jgi:hypothetical protein
MLRSMVMMPMVCTLLGSITIGVVNPQGIRGLHATLMRLCVCSRALAFCLTKQTPHS